MITRIHHVGVVVRELDRTCPIWAEALGLPLLRAAELPDQGVRAVLLACGPAEIELLEPTRPETGVARFLARRGGGLHHLCFESDDVGRELAYLDGRGVELIDRVARPGLAGQIAFLHPRACAGVLVEVATPPHPTTPLETPLALRVVRVTVEDAPAAARLYRDLFGLPTLDASRLVVGGVTLQFDTERAGDQAGLAALTLEATGLPAVLARLARHGLLAHAESGGLGLASTVTHGVPLSIRQSDSQEEHT